MRQRRSLSRSSVGFIVAAISGLVGLGLLQQAFAAGQLRLAPSSSSVQDGSNVNVAVRISPDQPVDGVEATLTYDQSKLQFVSIDSSGSAFPVEIQQSGGNGKVDVVRAHMTGTVNGDALVTNVTFKALAGSGNTTVQVTGNAIAGTSYIDPSFVNATLTLTTPASSSGGGSSGGSGGTGSSGGGSSSSGGGSSSGGNTGTKPPSSGGSSSGSGSGGSQGSGGSSGSTDQGDIGLAVRRKRVEFTKVVLRATAKKNARIYFIYGLNQDQLDVKTSVSDLSKEHEATLDPALMIPGTIYYYRAVAEDEQGNIAESSIEKFKTKGFRIRCLVTDTNERPVKNKKVTLRSDPITAETDDNGYATFEDVAPGKHKLEYEQDGKVHAETVLVAGDEPIDENKDGTQQAAPENIQVSFKNVRFAETSRAPIMLPAFVITGLVMVAGLAFFITKRRQNRFGYVSSAAGPDSFANASTPPTVGSPDQKGDLINKVKGLDRPDPGSVVSPKDDDKDEG